ncbi:hypothetical protein HU200_063318 [Digitaria exilis]|uniref:Uncharacterized protein n=1 Tax=Digitaria exilis TaxID=1010633 RepID=A0A835DWL1_9POAL|nr:hypothetical protein HU200_063318 [Digitaria exilis]
MAHARRYMMLVTFSAFLVTIEPCVVGSWRPEQRRLPRPLPRGVRHIGSGGVHAALLPFVAEQYDDDSALDREPKMSFVSWFYICVDFAMIVSGLLIVWFQQNITRGASASASPQPASRSPSQDSCSPRPCTSSLRGHDEHRVADAAASTSCWPARRCCASATSCSWSSSTTGRRRR